VRRPRRRTPDKLISLLLAAVLFAQSPLQHAQALLWSGRYADAKREFRAILARNPRDENARFGLAQAEYWSGDFRAAARDFRLVHRREAQTALREIEAASRPGWAAEAAALSDDQPYRAVSGTVSAYVFSDPLTKWQVDAEDAHRTSNGSSASTPFVRGGVTTSFVPVRIAASLARMRFPDATSQFLPSLSIGTKTLTLSFERQALLRTTASLLTHPTADAVTASWRDDDRAAVEAQHLRYFDGNRGNGADAWLLRSVGALRVGGSVAWRDTAESRFVNGVYDPYYSPQRLREARAIVAAKWRNVDLHFDAGAGHEATVGSFHPWRAAASFTWKNVSVSAERSSTAFYTANEIRAGVAGRF